MLENKTILAFLSLYFFGSCACGCKSDKVVVPDAVARKLTCHVLNCVNVTV